MKLKSISIAPGSDYGPHKGKFVAKAVVVGELNYSETEINVTVEPDQLEPIVQILSQLVAQNMAAAAAAFADEVRVSLMPPAVEHGALEPPRAPVEDDGTVAF